MPGYNFYAVIDGREGCKVYSSWDECKEQVWGWKGVKFKGFNSQAEADLFAFGSGADTAHMSIIADSELTERVARVDEFNKCHLCERLLCRPVFLTKCGHSPWCQQCISLAKPKPKSCPLCGETVTGAPGRWPINAALGAALRCLFPEEYNNRPTDEQLKHELDRQSAVNKLKAAIYANDQQGECKSELSGSLR